MINSSHLIKFLGSQRGLRELEYNDILHIDQLDRHAVEQSGYFKLKVKSEEYIYQTRMLKSLEGSKFRSLRRKLRSFSNIPNLIIRPYQNEDKAICLKLLNNWRENLAQNNIKVYSYDYRYMRACLELFPIFKNKALEGTVIIIDEKLQAFQFMGPISNTVSSSFITISNHQISGLGYFLRHYCFTHFCFTNMSTENYIND